MSHLAQPLAIVALLCIGLSAAIVVWFLATRPSPSAQTKLILLAGIAGFPIAAAMATNVVGYQTTQKRSFCAGCHLMTPYTEDSQDPNSTSLAARHARNRWFGPHNCYTCHADYAMFGTITTKVSGMHHVWAYYVGGQHALPLADTIGRIELYQPFSNRSCLECHSGQTSGFDAVPDHRGLSADLAGDLVRSCRPLASGCFASLVF
jgi:nitrate/TMAO reductase-like tetraheme cytochrome c subunit